MLPITAAENAMFVVVSVGRPETTLIKRMIAMTASTVT